MLASLVKVVLFLVLSQFCRVSCNSTDVCSCKDHKHERLRARVRDTADRLVDMQKVVTDLRNGSSQQVDWLVDVRNELSQVRGQLLSIQGDYKQLKKTHAEENKKIQLRLAALETGLREKRCESGQKWFKPHYEPTVSAEHGKVIRKQTQHVQYASPFSSPPAVTAGVTRLDSFNHKQLRVYAAIDNRTVSGFDLSVEEWSDSNNFAAAVRWMACSA
ncbi:uncharacterized protein [Littorina saxatilis]|uniref:H-type lectin domain-containing protein n=1 Tax=Littorina saxatilis TaxID=31220 RepID=A0AAN9AXE2_9CAEN